LLSIKEKFVSKFICPGFLLKLSYFYLWELLMKRGAAIETLNNPKKRANV
jgi:hypothetical protein